MGKGRRGNQQIVRPDYATAPLQVGPDSRVAGGAPGIEGNDVPVSYTHLYWWFHPAINIHSTDFWGFVFIVILLPLFLVFWMRSKQYKTCLLYTSIGDAAFSDYPD